MTHLNNSNRYNPKDYYLLVFKNNSKVYEKFAHKTTAERFLHKHPLEDELEIIVNPKYKGGKSK